MLYSVTCLLGLFLLPCYIDYVAAGVAVQRHDNVNLVGIEQSDPSAHEVLRRHKRQLAIPLPGMKTLCKVIMSNV